MQRLLESHGISHALDTVGSSSKYQVKVTLIMTWQYLFRSFFLIYYAYLTQPPVFSCEDPDNPGQFYDCYENNGGCKDQRLSENSPSSLVNDLGFYCDQMYVRTMGGSFFFIGGYIGVAIFSFVSDKFGRKNAIQYSYLVGSLGLFLLGVATVGPFTYVFFLMVVWAGMSCYLFLSLVYLSEVSNEKFSRNGSAFLLLSITVGEILIIFLAYLIPTWSTLFVWFIGVPALLSNISFIFLDETPVFLYSKKEISKTVAVLKKIARFNNKPIEEAPSEALTVARPQSDTTEKSVSSKSYTYLEILLHPQLQKRIFIFSLIRLYLSLAYWGCIFTLSSIGGNMSVNATIACVAEGLGYALSFKAYLFPTRKLLKGSLQVVMIMGFSFLLVPKFNASDNFSFGLFLQSLLSLVMRTAVCFIYGFIYSLGNELFPTEVRSQANGLANIFADLGGFIAPFMSVLSQTYHINPLFLLGVLGVAPLMASQYLPEEKLTQLDEFNAKEIELLDVPEKNKDGYTRMD